jgi:hypothetical protein
MQVRFRSGLLLIWLTASLTPGGAQTRPTRQALSADEVRAVIEQARAKKHWLKVEVRVESASGGQRHQPPARTCTYKGRVTEIADRSFTIEDSCLFCEGRVIGFSEVVSIKRRPHMLRVLRGVGQRAIFTPVGLVAAYLGSFRN